MSKYNYELDLTNRNSLSIIAEKIIPKTEILEFGPAHGRLTRYLKEVKNCVVDIVEIDEEAGKEASKYARTSCIGKQIGDIESYEWMSVVKNRYDYIILADVLEHLYNPGKVLLKCKAILKDNGKIIISIPNISHNSILINLYQDNFEYTDVGLLDNTHIRFFTLNSFKHLVNRIQMNVVSEDAVYSLVGENEVFVDYNQIPKELSYALRQRSKGNVYQYVLSIMNKHESYEVEQYKNLDYIKDYNTSIYIKGLSDDTFNSEKMITRQYIGSDLLDINISQYNQVDRIKICPINTTCICKVNSAYGIDKDGNKIKLSLEVMNAVYNFSDIYIFNTIPYIEIKIMNQEVTNILVQIKILVYDFEYQRSYHDLMTELDTFKNGMMLKVDKLESFNQNINNEYEKEKKVNEQLQNEYEKEKKVNEQLQNEYEKEKKVNEQLQNEYEKEKKMNDLLKDELEEQRIVCKTKLKTINELEMARIQENDRNKIEIERLKETLEEITSKRIYKILKKIKG